MTRPGALAGRRGSTLRSEKLGIGRDDMPEPYASLVENSFAFSQPRVIFCATLSRAKRESSVPEQHLGDPARAIQAVQLNHDIDHPTDVGLDLVPAEVDAGG